MDDKGGITKVDIPKDTDKPVEVDSDSVIIDIGEAVPISNIHKNITKLQNILGSTMMDLSNVENSIDAYEGQLIECKAQLESLYDSRAKLLGRADAYRKAYMIMTTGEG